jgi:hypothetical protein
MRDGNMRCYKSLRMLIGGTLGILILVLIFINLDVFSHLFSRSQQAAVPRTRAISFTSQAEASNNGAEVKNPDSSEALQGQQVQEVAHYTPSGWNLVSIRGIGTLQSDLQIARSGRASALISAGPTQKPYEFTAIGQQCAARGFAGRRIAFAAFLRTEGAFAGGNLWTRADNRDGFSVALDNRGNCRVRATTDWTDCRVVIDIPDSAASITYGAMLYGAGSLWIDDASIEVLDENVPVTSRARETGVGAIQHNSNDLLDEPVNLGFEDMTIRN